MLSQQTPYVLIQSQSRRTHTIHYSDAIKSTMAFQITGVSIVQSTVCSGAHQRKHQNSASLALCAGNSPETGEFPTQRASNAENASIRWRHCVVTTNSLCINPKSATKHTHAICIYSCVCVCLIISSRYKYPQWYLPTHMGASISTSVTVMMHADWMSTQLHDIAFEMACLSLFPWLAVFSPGYSFFLTTGSCVSEFLCVGTRGTLIYF